MGSSRPWENVSGEEQGANLHGRAAIQVGVMARGRHSLKLKVFVSPLPTILPHLHFASGCEEANLPHL